MKKILIISTGGTICSSLSDGCRRLNADAAEMTLIDNFFKNPKYAALPSGLFEKRALVPRTLSENMTLQKLELLIALIKEQELDCYSGIIVLHGTDTLAYTAALLAIVFSTVQIPILLVSGDAPPDIETSNANDNFASAFDCISEGIAPNVYVLYRNAGENVKIHLGSRLMQSPDFSSSFYSAANFEHSDFDRLSKSRKPINGEVTRLDGSVLKIDPYVGLDYSRISIDGIKAVAHGAYHSGTFCIDGEETSLLSFARRCKQKGILIFVAPCKMGEEQYESVAEAVFDGAVIPIYMTSEMLYIKLIVALSLGLEGSELKNFINTEYNNEKE